MHTALDESMTALRRPGPVLVFSRSAPGRPASPVAGPPPSDTREIGRVAVKVAHLAQLNPGAVAVVEDLLDDLIASYR